jgi:signal transduction histidine kinase
VSENLSIENSIRYNILFDSLDESLIDRVLDKIEEKSFQAGSIIFEDETPGDALYLLLSGTVDIVKRSPSGEDTLLGVLHAGDFFGELELIDDRSRSAHVIASADCKLCRIDKLEFEALLETSPRFTANLLKLLSLRLRNSNIFFAQQLQTHHVVAQNQLHKMQKLIEAAKTVNSTLDTDKLLEIILKTATTAVHADRGTLYLLDEARHELWSKVLQGSAMVEIRLPVGTGIAGYVAGSGQTINIPNAYLDPRFNPEIDKTTGYRTQTILCMPMRNKDGKVIGVFQLLNKTNGRFTSEDENFIEALSVHAAIAVENAQLAQEMVQGERLSAVGRMASSIIHDIKNPMGTLRIYAQVMKKKSRSRETTKLADEMIKQVDRFVTMTQEILDFSRGVSQMNIQTVSVPELTDTVLTFIEKDLTRHKIQLNRNLRFEGSINADEEKLARVFYNIVGNAIDAMPKGGMLTVSSFQEDNHLVLEFIDTGTGIPEEIRNKIFQPFFTHGKKHGTGLGMAIVKKIIDDHKGTIEVESAQGNGTTIRLLLPLPSTVSR